MTAQLLATDILEIVPEWVRKPSKVDDDILKNSMEAGGIQIPVIVVRDGDRHIVADGIRRVTGAKAMGIKVPAIVFDVPEGQTAEDYARRMRFILDELRQDLMPSQRAELIEKLKSQFRMGNVAVAQYLGVDSDSITNWLAVRQYTKPIVEALDAGRLTMQAARVFDGMSEKGQRHVWKAHASELCDPGAGKLHRAFRLQYPPDKVPEFYRDPETMMRRFTKRTKGGKRRTIPRPSFTDSEKAKLIRSYDMKENELAEVKAEVKELKAAINAAIPIVSAIMRHKKLWAMVPESMQFELETFAQHYA